jgi:MscS family membrane protein
LFNVIHNKWKTVEKNEFISLIVKPLGWFLAVLISVIAIDNLIFPDILKFDVYGVSFQDILHRLGICMIIIFLIWVIQGFINFIAFILDLNSESTKDKRDDQIIVFFRDFFKVILHITGILVLLKIGFGVNIGSVLTGLSIIGAALALAAKESIENLIASFIIFFDKPFYTGDVVKVNNINGTIEHIGLRSTRIRTIDQTLVTVPNKQMVDSIVDNWSMRIGRRSEIKIELENTTETMLIDEFVDALKSFLQNKYPVNKSSVFITDYTKSSIVITVEYQTETISMDDFMQFKQLFNLQIKKWIEEKNIKFAKGGNDINIYNNETVNSNISSSNKII